MESESSYLLDTSNRILSVGGDWDSFALENGGEKATENAVTGRSLWDFVSGFETKSYLNAIFFACRHNQQSFQTTYRCDSPQKRNLFCMSVVLRRDQTLLCSHSLLKSDPVWTPVDVHNYCEDHRCSMCCRNQIRDRWVYLSLTAPQHDLPTRFSICPDCKTAARAALACRAEHTMRHMLQ